MRIKLLKGTATLVFGMALLLGLGLLSAQAFNQSPPIPLFQTTLRGVGPGQIPVAGADPSPAPVTGVKHYNILISQFQDQILPYNNLYKFPKTTLWGYNPVLPLGGGLLQPQKHLGGIIVAKGKDPQDPTDKNEPIQIYFQNLLYVKKHILPVDVSIPGAALGPTRTAVHLHGGLVPWISDGGPFDWFGPYGAHGDSFLNNKVLNPLALPGGAEYYYPLNQSARFMWYHDHAVGITRLNAYAGIASGMLIRDKFEAGLVAGNGLPPYIESSVLGGKTVQELPVVVQDKIFLGVVNPDTTWNSLVQDKAQKPGSLWYAHEYDTARWEKLAGTPAAPNPSSIPEFFGDTMLVNGTTFPETNVQARRYRLRLLNACNARFLNLQLYVADVDKLDQPLNTNGNGIALDANGIPLNKEFVNAATGNPTWLQIGTEGGFLSAPTEVPSNVPFLITDPDFLGGGSSLDPTKVEKSLIVAPAERPDVIVDFKGYEGKSIILYSDAPAPFPSGDDRNDYFPGFNTLNNPVNGTTPNGFGPNTRVLMRFTVVPVPAADPGDALLAINGVDFSQHIDPSLIPTWGSPDTTFCQAPNCTFRKLTLNEYHDEFGRLIQIIGNVDDSVSPNPFSIWGTPYFGTAYYSDYPPFPPVPGSPASVGFTQENVNPGATEIWEVYNATGDVHPMHFHLVNVQLINRQTFDVDTFNGTGTFAITGDPIPPDTNELGWKETVPMYPGTVTRVIMNFDVALAQIVDKNLNPITTKLTRLQKLLGQLPIIKGQPPVSPRTGGYEYVWHCHILEHEEHDMMHTLNVKVTP